MFQTSAVWPFLLTVALASDFNPEHWYQRHYSYPQYCSTFEEMEKRVIPMLKERDKLIGETRILHATAIIRHGARTPWTSDLECWGGYWDSVETGVWDCDLTTIMAPPPPNQVRDKEGDRNWDTDNSFFLFEKQYDALQYPQDGLTNELNGTCQRGQLLLRGYEQEIRNGRILRDAYSYLSDDPYEHDERMRLIDLSSDSFTPWDPHHLRLRADDDQRTLMSGQVLLRGLFDEEVMSLFYRTGMYPQIKVHTADRSRDVLDSNARVCPKLKTIANNALQSDEFQAWNNSKEVQALFEFMNTTLGKSDQDSILDCLMTTICTDRPLPEAIDDYGENQSMFTALAELDIKNWNFVMKYNNSEHAKLGMGPLWAEILDNIYPFIMEGPDAYFEEMPVAPKLAVFSGHDTTIMPLLASLGENLWNETDWPPYASMFIIEIHEIVDFGFSDTTVYTTPFAFRLLFNGKILTPLVEGCPPESELCDAQIFLDLVKSIATRNPNCSVKEAKAPVVVMEQAKTLMSTKEGVYLCLGLVFFSAIVGAVGGYILLTGKLPFTQKTLFFVGGIGGDECERRGLQENGFHDEPGREGSFVNGHY